MWDHLGTTPDGDGEVYIATVPRVDEIALAALIDAIASEDHDAVARFDLDELTARDIEIANLSLERQGARGRLARYARKGVVLGHVAVTWPWREGEGPPWVMKELP